MRYRFLILWPIIFIQILTGTHTMAREASEATFALIVGVNQGVDDELPLLRYADDDAAMYFNLFRALGAKTLLLMRADKDTRLLQPQASAEARIPTKANLLDDIIVLRDEIARARQRGIKTALYFIYSGHGNAKGGQGYILLRDERLTSDDLETFVVKRMGADTTHVIVDACYSLLLASTRGPGGRRRPIVGFSHHGPLVDDENVGLLLSTTSSQKSFEWEGFQAGVFSHEVRSGLYGAADANGDGWVDYREIAAFVQKANAAIPNQRLRPRVFARHPSGSENLLDIRVALKRRLDIDGSSSAHYFMEDFRGIRIADFHNAPGQSLSIFRPLNMGNLYLRRVDTGTELFIPRVKQVVSVADLQEQDQGISKVAQRGPLEQSLRSLFSLPFSKKDVEEYSFEPVPVVDVYESAYSSMHWKDTVGWSLAGLSVASVISGVVSSVFALSYRSGVSSKTSQRDVASINDRIGQANTSAEISYALAAASGVLGLVFLLWPDSGVEFRMGNFSTTSGVEMYWRF